MKAENKTNTTNYCDVKRVYSDYQILSDILFENFQKRKHYKCRNPLKTRYKRCIAPNKRYQENEQKLKNISFIFCQTFLVVARRLVVLLQYRTIVQHRLLFFVACFLYTYHKTKKPSPVAFKELGSLPLVNNCLNETG